MQLNASAYDSAELLVIALRKEHLPLHDAADAHLSKFSVVIRYAFAMGRKKLPDTSAAVKAVQLALKTLLPKALERCAIAGGKVTASTIRSAESDARYLARTVKLTMQFDAKNPRIAEWAKSHAAELITEISATTRNDLRDVVVQHTSGELTDKDYAKAIRDAVGDEIRTDLIARTETMRAVHFGQREAWRQAKELKLLKGDLRRVWIVTSDDRLCPECEALDGATASQEGEYRGGYEGPPAHPRCRCTEGLQ